MTYHSHFSSEWLAVERAAAERIGHAIYLESVLDAAAEALLEVTAVLAERGIAPADLPGSLAGAVLDAQAAAYRRTSASITPQRVDPGELLEIVVAEIGARLGPGDPPPVRSDPGHAQVVLLRLPGTPPWGPDGTAPLVLTLARTGHGPWLWSLAPRVEGAGPGSLDIVAPPPGTATARDIADLISDVLTGETPIS